MATTPKKYVPMDLDAAEEFIMAEAPLVDLGTLDDGMRLIYAETLKLHQRIDEIENQANEMMSPEKLSEMTAGFLGGGMG